MRRPLQPSSTLALQGPSRFHSHSPSSRPSLHFASFRFPSRRLPRPSLPFPSSSCPSLPFPSVPCPSLPFASLPFPSRLFSSLRFPSLRFPSLRFPSLTFASRPFASLRFASLHFPSLRFASLHFASLPFDSRCFACFVLGTSPPFSSFFSLIFTFTDQPTRGMQQGYFSGRSTNKHCARGSANFIVRILNSQTVGSLISVAESTGLSLTGIDLSHFSQPATLRIAGPGRAGKEERKRILSYRRFHIE